MKEIREVGARIRLIPHGDVSAALVAVTEGSPVDLLYGIGGTPEGVLAAAAIKCTGGQILGRLWPRSDEERSAALEAGYDLDEVLDTRPARVRRGRLLRRHRRDRRRDARRRPLHRARRAPPRSRSRCAPARGRCARITARHDRAKLREIVGRAPGLSAPDRPSRLQVQVRQRAQERVGHDHVDAQLGLVVEEAADAGEPAPAGDQRVEVDDLGADGRRRLARRRRSPAGAAR